MSFIEAEARDKGITVNLDVDHRLPPIVADSVQIQQVLLNLIRNGIEAMTLSDCRERKLIISADRTEDSELQERIQEMKQAGVVLLACKACSDSYGVSGNLEKLGVEVKYMGEPFTQLLKDGHTKVLTF